MDKNLQKILNQNNQVKKEISKYSFGETPFIDDSIIRGGYRVVRTVKERDAIDCCHRKLGMRVMVIGQDYSFKDYILKGEDHCTNDNWILAPTGSGGGDIDTITDGDVTLLDDYSELDVSEEIKTQQDLNKVMKNLLITILGNQIAGDKHFTFDQHSPSNTWIIYHPLNKKPSIEVVDTAGTKVEGQVTYNSLSQVTITFNFPFSGEAYLN